MNERRDEGLWIIERSAGQVTSSQHRPNSNGSVEQAKRLEITERFAPRCQWLLDFVSRYQFPRINQVSSSTHFGLPMPTNPHDLKMRQTL